MAFTVLRWMQGQVVLASILAIATPLLATSEAEARSRKARNATAVSGTTAALTVAAVDPTVSGALKRETQAAAPQVPLVAAVSLREQQVTIYAGTNVVARSPISSGMTGYATPTGVFSIIQKARYHESNIYDNAPMPFMQRLTWSGVAFHAGRLPGYPASHGCVRLPHDFAERLFGMLKMGTRVVVAQDVAAPAPVVHAMLPKPIYTSVAAIAQNAGSPAAGLMLASVGTGDEAAREQWLSPPQWAEHEKRRAAAALADAQEQARVRLETAKTAAAEADEARGERLRVEREVASFQSQLQRAQEQRERAGDDEARMQATASMHAFEDAILDAKAALVELARIEAARREASFVEARRARDGEEEVERADAALKVANRGSEPITVFVSRADGRVQVRQGHHTILAGDVQISEPNTPLGTHVLTAGPVKSMDEGLTWTGVSIADGGVMRSSAVEALARVTFDPEIREAIGRRTWSGATVLISDQPASKETGKGTDFIVLTR